jgi:hypothetical protein
MRKIMYCCISSAYPLKNTTSLWRPDIRFHHTLSTRDSHNKFADQSQMPCDSMKLSARAASYNIYTQMNRTTLSQSRTLHYPRVHERVNHHRFHLCCSSPAPFTNPSHRTLLSIRQPIVCCSPLRLLTLMLCGALRLRPPRLHP